MSGKITIIGLGSGNENSLTLGIYKLLKKSENIYLRTRVHPIVDFLIEEQISFQTFDYLYDQSFEYEVVYQEIAISLINEAKLGKKVVYAVPGHPMVAEKSVKNLIEAGKKEKIGVEVLGGESFLDTFFSRLNIDPIDGFLFLNGETVTRDDIIPSKNILVGQVYNRFIASDLKLTLMEIYPDETPIWLVANLGIDGQEMIKQLPLYELDYEEKNFHHLSSLFIPASVSEHGEQRQFYKLVETVKILRSPNGCPWDREQTHKSIRKNLIEETYELLDAIDAMDIDNMIEELGDVFLQVLFHSEIAEEEGYFDIYDVIEQLNLKLLRRHPHVFGDEAAQGAEEALDFWNKMKSKEKSNSEGNRTSILDGIPKELPTILKAYKLQKKAAKVNFDWTSVEDVYRKIEEELEEVKTAKGEEQLKELGDLLFAIINLSRFLGHDPEEALSLTNKKFIQRFNYIEESFNREGILFEDASLELMEKYWNEAKNAN